MDDQFMKELVSDSVKKDLVFSEKDRKRVFKKLEQQPMKRKNRSFFTQVAPTLAAFATILIIGVFTLSSGLIQKEESGMEQQTATAPVAENVTFSLLLLGIDENQRNDINAVLTYNRKENSIYMTYLPRDTYVTISTNEGDRKDKLAHAYKLGGTDAAVSAVEDLFNLPIDYFVTADRETFEFFFDSENVNLNQLQNGKEVFEWFNKEEKQKGRANAEKLRMETLYNLMSNGYPNITESEMKNFFDKVETNVPKEFIDSIPKTRKEENRPSVTGLSVLGGRVDKHIDGIYYVEIEQSVLNHVSTEFRRHINLNK